MRYQGDGRGSVFVHLERGESIRTCVEKLSRDRRYFGWVQAIGAIYDPELGYYDLTTRSYERRTFPGAYELTSFQGNITLKEDQPFLHAHVTIGDREFLTFSGHLFDAKVEVVVEMVIRTSDTPIRRSLDSAVGLWCWALPDRLKSIA